MLNSRLSLFSVTSFHWYPFSLGYGVILPSSLTTLLPSVCGFSPRLPVSVCGTGTHIAIAAFLVSVDSTASLLLFAPSQASVLQRADLPTRTPLPLARLFHSPGLPTLLCPHSSEYMRYRNFYLLSIDYGFRPRLRPRLTLSRLALLRKP